jgi:hypothetical protein
MTTATDMKPLQMTPLALPEFNETFSKLYQQSENIQKRAPMFMHYCAGNPSLMDQFTRLMGVVSRCSSWHALFSPVLLLDLMRNVSTEPPESISPQVHRPNRDAERHAGISFQVL